jgi:hypothetical protein
MLAMPLLAGSTGAQHHRPQGTATVTNYGDWVSSNDGAALNTFYRYFIEVPPSQTRLVVDLFDPDIGLGGATEDTAGRDRDRGGYASTATYSLLDPNGTSRTVNYTTGSVTLPAGGDNAWVTLFDSTGDNVRDQFGAAAYNNNDGSVNWAGNWIETNDDANAGGGLILITGGELRIRDDGAGGVSTIEREVNASAFGTATLTFALRTTGTEAGDQMRVQVSNNGGGSWTTLETFTGAYAATTRSYDISAYIATNTRVRFVQVTGYTGTDSFFVDNVDVKGGVIRSGHWELRVDMGGDDDIHAIGIRAHDGTSGSGGTEYNVYADSMISVGANPPAAGTASQSYTLYPYITSGCTCNQNDFDLDSDSGNIGSITYTSRSGAFSQSLASATLSPDDTWNRDTITGWTSDNRSNDYGIWQYAQTVNSYLVAGTPNGNYGVIYTGNSSAAANPPTANPITNAFRIYVPTDAGTAPVKPYIEQFATRNNGTPQVGVMKPVTVTIRVENPTAWPITFSTPTNIITSNVPGAGAVYGGNAQVSQGSIVSQPAVGGTGNVTWNPGTLAAGATAIIAYDVRVTPTSAGQRIPVTGTVASGNGTRAIFLDETANATQARATYTAGPICELAVTEGLLTDVFVSRFDASVHGNHTTLDWSTVSESGTIGFNLYRLDNGLRTKVNAALLLANPGAPQGGRYRYSDNGSTNPQATYILEEVMSSGKLNSYGPYAINGKAATDANGYTREARRTSKAPNVAKSGRKAKATAVAVAVSRTGLVRVAASDIATQLNSNPSKVEAAIRNGGVRVTDRGVDVAWTPSAAGDALYFFGEKGNSIYSNDRVYKVELSKGVMMPVKNASPSSGATSSFRTSLDLEQDVFSATVIPVPADSDYWFSDFFVSGDPTYGHKQYTLDVPAVASSDAVTLQVRLQGAMPIAHAARIALNGVPVGELSWNDYALSTAALSIPPGLLNAGSNQLDVEGIVPAGEAYDVFYLDGYALNYSRFATASAGALEIPQVSGIVNANGFGANPVVLDITNRQRPALVQGSAVAAGNVGFATPAGTQSVFISDDSAIVAPSGFRGMEDPVLGRTNRADYLVITPLELRAGAEALAQFHQSEGLQTFVADLDQIYDEFAGGNATPLAIRDFILSTTRWSRAPKYVVLVGSGTYDYRGLELGTGLMPALMTSTSNGLFASDSLFADFNGDSLPDLAIGRIPAWSASELDAYLRKLQSSSRAAVEGRTLMFAADATDRGADFRAASEKARGSIAGAPADHAYVDEIGSGAHDVVRGSWQNGTPLVSWFGHGGIDRLSNFSVLGNEDVATLKSGSGLLPVLVAMTCTINRFELGTAESLGENLTRAADGGALAVWSATGLSEHGQAVEFQSSFMRAAAAGKARVGDLVMKAFAENRAIGETASVYVLLGDPAAFLRVPATASPAPRPRTGIE